MADATKATCGMTATPPQGCAPHRRSVMDELAAAGIGAVVITTPPPVPGLALQPRGGRPTAETNAPTDYPADARWNATTWLSRRHHSPAGTALRGPGVQRQQKPARHCGSARRIIEHRRRVHYLYAACKKNGLTLDQRPATLPAYPACGHPARRQKAVPAGAQHWQILLEEWKHWFEAGTDDLPDTENLADDWANLPPLADAHQGVLRQGHKMLRPVPASGRPDRCGSPCQGAPWPAALPVRRARRQIGRTAASRARTASKMYTKPCTPPGNLATSTSEPARAPSPWISGPPDSAGLPRKATWLLRWTRS